MKLRNNLLYLGYFIISFPIAIAQEVGTSLKNSHTLKIHANVNPYEFGTTFSHQYYPSKNTGIQTNISLLFPVDYSYDDEDYSISGIGYRINPEFRFYTGRRTTNRMASFFVGAGPMLKYFKKSKREWNSAFDSNTGNLYKKLDVSTFKNFSYGIMAIIGVEGFFDQAKRFTFEASYSLGLTQNRLKIDGDKPTYNEDFILRDISVSNESEGLLPYVDFRLGIGYRFGKK